MDKEWMSKDVKLSKVAIKELKKVNASLIKKIKEIDCIIDTLERRNKWTKKNVTNEQQG